jgi:hypothetical protein
MSLDILFQPNPTNITVLQSAGNDSIYSVSGDTYLSPNTTGYKFTADVYVNGVLETTLKSFPDPVYGYGLFNLNKIAPNFLTTDFIFEESSPEALFHNCPNSSAKIQLVFGEEYTLGSPTGSTFVQNKNIASSNASIYINSSLSFTDQEIINLQNYLLVEDSGGTLFLQNNPYTNIPSEGPILAFTAFQNQRRFLYFANNNSDSITGSGTVKYMFITTLAPNGSQIGNYKLISPFTNATATDIQSIEVGYPQLAALTPGHYTVIGGPTNIFGNGEVAYTIVLLGNTSDGGEMEQIYFTIASDCGKYASTAYTVHWLNAFGGFDSWLFNKKNEITQNKQASTYKKTYGTLNSDGSYTINTWDRNSVQYYTKLQNSININTDFLTDAEVLYLEGLFSSPVVYIEDQTGLLQSVIVKPNSYVINKVVNKRIYSLSLTVEPASQSFRQNQ